MDLCVAGFSCNLYATRGEGGPRLKPRKRRTGLVERTYSDVYARTQGLRRGRQDDPGSPPGDPLLARAERNVRRKIWLRKTLPLNIILLLPGLLFLQTDSGVVLAGFVAGFPVLLLIRALLSRALSAWLGSEELLLRKEIHRLMRQAEELELDAD